MFMSFVLLCLHSKTWCCFGVIKEMKNLYFTDIRQQKKRKQYQPSLCRRYFTRLFSTVFFVDPTIFEVHYFRTHSVSCNSVVDRLIDNETAVFADVGKLLISRR